MPKHAALTRDATVIAPVATALLMLQESDARLTAMLAKLEGQSLVGKGGHLKDAFYGTYFDTKDNYKLETTQTVANHRVVGLTPAATDDAADVVLLKLLRQLQGKGGWKHVSRAVRKAVEELCKTLSSAPPADS